jgi:hypothetical protein
MEAAVQNELGAPVVHPTWLQAAAVACQAIAKVCRTSIVSLQVVIRSQVSQQQGLGMLAAVMGCTCGR